MQTSVTTYVIVFQEIKKSSRLNDLFYKLFLDVVGSLIVDLAGADGLVPAAAVFQHQLADIDLGGTVQHGFAHGENGIEILFSRQDMHGNIASGIHGVNGKAVGRVNLFFLAEVQHQQ